MSADRPAAIGVPPAELRLRVAGTEDPDWFDASGRRHLALFERALDRVGKRLSDFENIFDFGCGPGRIMRHLAAAAPRARLHGSDIDPPGVAWLRRELPEADVEVNGGLPPLPFPADSFDLVVSWSVFTHLPEGHQNAWLHELRRVTRPGAVLLLTVHGETNWRWHVEHSIMKDAPELDELAAERSRRGFVQWTGGVGPDWPDFYRTTFHRPQYVRRHWSRWLSVIDVVEAPDDPVPDQDVVVAENPGRVGAALRTAWRAPGGLRRRLGRRRGARAPAAPNARRVASIVLPVKDPGSGLSELLHAIRGQRWDGRVELVAVDAGSQDGTLEVLRDFGATVVEIDPTTFDHGHARNLGAEAANGDELVFVTQSMRPADGEWLARLLEALAADPRLAGVSSRLKPPPGVDPLTRMDGERNPSYSPERSVRSIDDPPAYQALSEEERLRFLSFTTVSCAIRAEVLSRVPFPRVRTIGEDLLWAKEVLEAGFAIGHEPASVAFHSHEYSFTELLGRDFDDGIVRAEVLGAGLEGDLILSFIGEQVRRDRRYLAEECGLEGPELEYWGRRAASRRTAQLVGQWLGRNHERLPAEAFEVLSLVRRVVNAEACEPRP